MLAAVGRQIGQFIDRKRAEEAPRHNEERFRLLVEGAKDYAMFMLTHDGRITGWNEGAQHLLGYQEEEVLGKHFSIFFTPEDQQAGKPQRELK
jgi:PAS domain S-box-containing protein